MAQYRTKPKFVEAIRWDGANTEDVMEFLGKMAHTTPEGRFFILTAYGRDELHIGSWAVKGDKGFHPCKPDIFERTYEAVE
jgi:hypothetical protein